MSRVSKKVGSCLRGVWQNVRITPQVVSLVWRASPAHACAECALNIVRGVTPVLLLWLTKLIVDTVVGVWQAQAGRAHRLAGLAVAFAAALVANDLGATPKSIVEANFHDLLAHRINVELLTKIKSLLGLSLFETPSFYDKLRNAEEGTTGYRPMSLFDMLSGAFTLSSYFGAVSSLLT